jgi:hypothetical protein
MKNSMNQKITRALIAGLLATNLPIPMAHAVGFEEGQETLTPPSITPMTGNDSSIVGVVGGLTHAASEDVALVASSVEPTPHPINISSLGTDIQSKILNNLSLQELLQSRTLSKDLKDAVSLCDLEPFLLRQLAYADSRGFRAIQNPSFPSQEDAAAYHLLKENFEGNLRKFISLWRKLVPLTGGFPQKVRGVLETFTPEGHMTLGDFEGFLSPLLQPRQTTLSQAAHELIITLPTSLLDTFRLLSWEETRHLSAIYILKEMSWKNRGRFLELVSKLPPFQDFNEFHFFGICSFQEEITKFNLLENIFHANNNAFLHLLSKLSPISSWEEACSCLKILSKTNEINQAHFAHLISQLPPVDSWEDLNNDNSNVLRLLNKIPSASPEKFQELVSHLPSLKDWRVLSPYGDALSPLFLLKSIGEINPVRFRELVFGLPPFENWEHHFTENIFSLLKSIAGIDRDLFKNFVSQLPPLKDWELFEDRKTAKLLEIIETIDQDHFLALVCDLPSFDSWQSPVVRRAAFDMPEFPLLKKIWDLNPSLFKKLVINLNPMFRSPSPLRSLIEKSTGIIRS